MKQTSDQSSLFHLHIESDVVQMTVDLIYLFFFSFKVIFLYKTKCVMFHLKLALRFVD